MNEKILFTFFNPSGGMDTLNRIRCEALQQAGVECHMMYRVDGEGRKNIRNTVIHICNEDEQIHALLRSQNYDAIVVCTDFYLLETIRSSGYSRPVIFEVQGLGTPDDAAFILDQAQPYVDRHASAILYPQTRHLIRMLRSAFPEHRHFCFDDPLNPQQFFYSPYPPRSSPVLAWVGRIEVNKNWEDFIQLGHRLLQHHPELYLWMFGDTKLFNPHEQEKFEARMEELQLHDRLIRYSNVPHELMADYFSIIGDSGGFLCSTSISEGFGYAVAEALLCRCPVLATDSDGVRNFIIHGKTGLFYPRGDMDRAEALALDLLSNSKLRESLRSRGERYIRKRFTPEKYVRRFQQMLRELKDYG